MALGSNAKWELDTISFDISLVSWDGAAAIVDGITRNQPVFHPNTARVCDCDTDTPSNRLSDTPMSRL